MIEKHHSYQMFNAIAKTYDRINRILSLGIDRHWRNVLTKEGLKGSPQKILDVATGTGEVLFHFIKKEPSIHYVGMDRSREMLGVAKTKQEKQKNQSIRFDEGDGEALSYQDHFFDAATIAFGIRNMPHPEKCLAEMARVLKVGGKCLVLEFSLPKNRVLKKFYLFYLRHILPKVGNLLSTHHEAYTYLNATIETFPHGLAFESLMKKNGFREVESRPLSFGIATLYVGVKCE